jgi:hypothetical protein
LFHRRQRTLARLENTRLSLPALDNPVDNCEQALYDSFKSLIYKETSCGAQKTGSTADPSI